MSFSREWLDDTGSEDSHGRCLWALGEVQQSQLRDDLKMCCADLFNAAISTAILFTSPRAWAFTLLGMPRPWGESTLKTYDTQLDLSDRLMGLYKQTRSKNWEWFEDSLSYDNARLPHSLLVAGHALDDSAKVAAGLTALNWLNQVQADTDGRFVPIGCDRAWRRGTHRPAYDQQPVDTWASVEANLCAYRLTLNEDWLITARSAYAWFHGHNRRSLPLFDAGTGGCRDGLQPHGLNANQGAESTLAYLLSTVAIREVVDVTPGRAKRGVLF